MLVRGECGADLGFDEAEDEECDADDADECVDAVVVVEEDRSDFEGLFGVAVAAFDDLLVLVEAQDLAGGERAGEVGRERVDAVERGRRGDRFVVALPGQGEAALRVVTLASIRPVTFVARISPMRRSTWRRVL